MLASPYAKQVTRAFRAGHASTLRSDAGAGDVISVTELRSDVPHALLTDPLAAEAATLVCVHLRDVERLQVWHDDRCAQTHQVARGSCTFHDLGKSPRFRYEGAFHILAFVLSHDKSRTGMSSDRCEPSMLDENCSSGPIEDRVLYSLAMSLLPFVNEDVRQNASFVEHVLRAAAIHLRSGGRAGTSSRPARRGGLAPWQRRQAVELLRSHLVEGISLDAVAGACRLSKSGFLRAFRESMGMPPHQWLLRCRIDHATKLMTDPALALSDIAVSSGFFDQSHFTRAFSRRMGLSPGAWRRAQLGASSDGEEVTETQPSRELVDAFVAS